MKCPVLASACLLAVGGLVLSGCGGAPATTAASSSTQSSSAAPSTLSAEMSPSQSAGGGDGASQIVAAMKLRSDQLEDAVLTLQGNGCITDGSTPECQAALVSGGVIVEALAIVVRQVQDQAPLGAATDKAQADESIRLLDAATQQVHGAVGCSPASSNECKTVNAEAINSLVEARQDVNGWTFGK